MKVNLLCLTVLFILIIFSSQNIAFAYQGDWQSVNCCGLKEIRYRFDNFQLKGIWGSSTRDIFIVGMNRPEYRPEGIILHFNGNKWRIIKKTDFRLNCVWGTSANNVFVGAGKQARRKEDKGSIILHYDGNDWRQMEFEQDSRFGNTNRSIEIGKQDNLYKGGPPIVAIWGSSADNIFAAGNGSGGPIFHFEGDKWVRMDSNRIPSLRDINGTSNQNVYAVGKSGSYKGRMMHYDGISWTTLKKGAFSSVWCSQSGSVFAVVDNSKILQNNSETWTETDLDTKLYDVFGITENDVYVVGEKGSIYHYDGTTWYQMDSGTENNIYAIWAVTQSAIYAVGSDGTILRNTKNSSKKKRWVPSENEENEMGENASETVVEKTYEIKLNDGRTIITQLHWEEGDTICYHKFGATMRLPKSDIKEIVTIE